MKKIKLLLIAGFMYVSIPVFAQISAATDDSKADESKNYSRVELSYNPLSLSSDYDGVDDLDFTGISLSYIRGVNITKTGAPLFIEIGARMTYAWSKEDEDVYYVANGYSFSGEASEKFSYFGITVPVNLTYRYAVPGSRVTIAPLLGFTMKCNLVAKDKIEATAVAKSLTGNGVLAKESTSEEYNFFDKGDVGKDLQFKRLQIGWNIGFGVNFEAYYLGLSYGSDLTKLFRKSKTNNWAITLGYMF